MVVFVVTEVLQQNHSKSITKTMANFVFTIVLQQQQNIVKPWLL